MSLITKMLIGGANVKMLREGFFSDVHIELSDQVEALENFIKRVGDYQFGNSLNPNYQQVKTEFQKLVDSFDEYNLGLGKFIDSYVKENPNVTNLELLSIIKEKFL